MQNVDTYAVCSSFHLIPTFAWSMCSMDVTKGSADERNQRESIAEC